MPMNRKYTKPYSKLNWFSEAWDKGDNAFKEFFEVFEEELIYMDISIYSYIETYVASGYFVPNMIQLLRRGSLPQVFLLHKFTFMSTEMSGWYEWYSVNCTKKVRVTEHSKEYIDKWLGKPEPFKPKDFHGENKYRKVRRQLSKEKWLMKAWEMGL